MGETLKSADRGVAGSGVVRERPILFSVVTGQPSQRGKRLTAVDGLTWRQRNREAVNARKRELYAASAEKHRERASRYRQANADRVNAYNARWSADYRAQLRAEFIAAYGGCCACCGEDEPLFLHLDHIHNDGAAHRREYKTGAKLIAQLKKQGWPKGRIRLLCANCNCGRAINGGVCPHEARHA